MTKLEEQFHEAMLNVYRRAKTECDYNATRFLQMVNEHGGLKAARMLLAVPGYSDGFTALWQCGRLDISTEAVVLQSSWSALFSAEELAVARRRLKEMGFPPSVPGSKQV